MEELLGINPIEELANAIVYRAAKDYKRALRRLKKDPEDEKMQIRKEEVENFFRSQWCCQLTDLNGEVLIEKIGKGVKRARGN